MRFNFVLPVLAVLAACQSDVANVQPEEAPVKERAIIGATEKCRTNPSPKCKFVLQQTLLRERLDSWVLGQCLEHSSDQELEICVREYFKVGFQPTASAASCEGGDMAFQLICITMSGESFDVAVRAGMQRAKTFDWRNWERSEGSAMTALRQQSADACDQMNRHGDASCASEALADRLGLPDEDFAVCAESGDQRDIEECLLEAHSLRFLESAIRRMKAPILTPDDVAMMCSSQPHCKGLVASAVTSS